MTRVRRAAADLGAAGPRAGDPHARHRPVREPAAGRRRRRGRWCADGSSTTGSCCASGRRRPPAYDRLERLYGPPQPVDEVFGRHTVTEMLALRRRLLGAPGRVADAATLLLGERAVRPRVAHVLRRPRRRPPVLGPLPARRRRPRRRLARTCSAPRSPTSTSRSTPPSAGSCSALPADADVMVVSPVGMDVNTSRADMLPEMLEAILDPARRSDRAGRRSGGCGPRCRAACGRRSRPPAAGTGRARPHRPARAARRRLEHDGGLRPPGREPGLRPAQPARPRARRHRRTRGRRRPRSTGSPTACSRSATSTGSRRSRRSNGWPTGSAAAPVPTSSPT